MRVFRNWFRSLSVARRDGPVSKRLWLRGPRSNDCRQHQTTLALESLEDRTVPSILFSNTGTRTITDTGGPILNHMQLDLIFWGSGWTRGGGPALRTNLQNTATAILNSTYFDGLSQYRNIGRGSLLRTDVITATDPPASFTTGFGGDVANFVTNNINSGTLPGPNGQILYFVVPQPGSVTSDCSCGGRHLAGIASNNRVFPYGLVSNPTGVALDTLSWIMSHEMAEAATNPEWNITVNGVSQAAFHVPNNNGDEIGDGEPDGNYLYRLNGARVQAYLSQRDHAYIVTTGQTQNFVVSSSHGLTVNGDQLANKNDTITVGQTSNGVRVNLDNEVAQFDPNDITSVAVNTGTGNDTVAIENTLSGVPVTVNLGGGTDRVNVSPVANNLDNIQGNVTVHGGAGFDTLQVFDDHNPTGRTYTVTASTITRGGAAVITFGSAAINSVVLSGGGGANVFNVLDTEPSFATTVDADSPTDTVNVRGTTGALTVNAFSGFAGSPQVNVGNAGSLQNIRGAVTVATDRFSTARLTVDDSADATGRSVALGINGSTATGTITGLTASGAVITFPQFNLASLTVLGGTGANTFTVGNTGTGFLTTISSGGSNTAKRVNVQGTTGPLTVNMQGTFTDFVNVGSAVNALDPIQGAVTANFSAGINPSLALNDQGASTNVARTYTITGTTIDRTGAARVTVSGLAGGTTALNGAGGGNTMNVQGNPGGLTINAGTGNNTINVGSAANSLDGFGTVSVTGQGGRNVFNVNDQGTTTAQSYAVQTAIPSVGRTGVFLAYSGMSSLALHAGSGGNTINVAGTLAATPVTVYAGPRNDLVNVGDSGNHLDSIQSTLTVNGQAGTVVNVNDQGTTTAKTYAISSAAVTRSGGPAINYGGLSGLTLNGGSGGNTINLESTAAGTTTTVNAGSGGSTINLSPTAHNLGNLAGLVNINGQGGTNTLNAFDQATTFSQSLATEILYQDHLTRDDPTRRTVFTYTGVQSVNVSAGRSDNNADEVFGVAGTPVGVPVTVTNASSGSGHVQFIVGSNSDNLDGILGLLTIHGRVGGTDFLELDDANPNPQTFTVTANTVSRTAIAPIVYDNQTELVLGTSGVALATVNVQSTAMATVTVILLGQAGDQATINAATLQNALVAESVGAVSVTVDDSGDNMPRAATFTTDPTFRYVLSGLAASAIYLELDPGSSMQVLGGSGGNSFNVQGLLPGATMSLDGGSGTNTLDYTGYTGSVVADLQTGVATGFSSIANIQNVTGASGGGDQGLYNLLIGNGGNVLTGGFGRRNILVAGGTASTLNAGDGEDLLIGGSTSYDTDPALAAWLQIAAYWAGTDDYFTRVANLTTGNGVPLLDATTVTGNGGGNTMIGDGALALIYSDGLDNVSGFDPNAIIVPITP